MMNSSKSSRLEIASPKATQPKFKKLFSPRNTDPLAPSSNNQKKSRIEMIEKEKLSYISLCSQLRRENQLLIAMNNNHMAESDNLSMQIQRAEDELAKVSERNKQEKKRLEGLLEMRPSKLNKSEKGSTTIEPQLRSLRKVLDNISTSQLAQFKNLSNKYKDLETEVRNAKKQICKKKNKMSTTRLAQNPNN